MIVVGVVVGDSGTSSSAWWWVTVVRVRVVVDDSANQRGEF